MDRAVVTLEALEGMLPCLFQFLVELDGAWLPYPPSLYVSMFSPILSLMRSVDLGSTQVIQDNLISGSLT